jgi:hypothetical protein
LRASFLNFLVNLLWTAICCAPVLVYWVAEGHPLRLYVELGLSLACMFIPTSLLKTMQLSSNRNFYERLGVKQAQFVTQNGKAVNTILRSTDPDYRIVRNRAALSTLQARMAMYEKYHLAGLTFFLITFAEALLSAQYALAALIFIANIIYNVYPILIQQYTRTRMPSRSYSMRMK